MNLSAMLLRLQLFRDNVANVSLSPEQRISVPQTLLIIHAKLYDFQPTDADGRK